MAAYLMLIHSLIPLSSASSSSSASESEQTSTEKEEAVQIRRRRRRGGGEECLRRKISFDGLHPRRCQPAGTGRPTVPHCDCCFFHCHSAGSERASEATGGVWFHFHAAGCASRRLLSCVLHASPESGGYKMPSPPRRRRRRRR